MMYRMLMTLVLILGLGTIPTATAQFFKKKDDTTQTENTNSESRKDELKEAHKDAKADARAYKKERKAAEAREKAAKARAEAIKAQRKAEKAGRKAKKADAKAEKYREKATEEMQEEEPKESFLDKLFKKKEQ